MSLLLLGVGAAPGGGVITSPTQISGLIGWYDASQETAADGTAMATIVNRQLPGTRDLAAVIGQQPLVKTGIQNGLRVYRFDGVNDNAKAAFALTQPTTVFCVAKLLAVNGAANAPFVGNGGGAAEAAMLYCSATTSNCKIETGGAGSVGTQVIGTAAFHRMAGVFNGASSSLQIDTITETGTLPAGDFAGICLGGSVGSASDFANADIGEVAVYNKACSTAEILQMMNYLKTKWATA